MPAGLRDVSPAPRSGLIAALPVADNLHLGVGRFAVRGHGGRHANLEPERRAADGRARGRAIAAVGFSFTF